jgi:hypothetical protein
MRHGRGLSARDLRLDGLRRGRKVNGLAGPWIENGHGKSSSPQCRKVSLRQIGKLVVK